MSRFGKYELLERIGIGGMAEVFKAKIYGAEGFERLIAIKRILPNLTEDDDFVKMFVDEAKIAVRLNHPNIVGIDDLGKAEGTLFIAMEYVQGKDLRAIYDIENSRGTQTPIGIAVHIVMKMCEALHHAHFATGPRGEPMHVIHRDVSPQNVLLSFDGEVKVADFGLAKARGRMVQTQAGVVKGKLAYMSPEQLRGDEIDHRVDVFGLGIVLFELLTGVRLFLGPSDMDTLRRVYEAKVPGMIALNPEIHPELEAITKKALAKDRDERYQTALALFEDLQAHVYGQGVYAGTTALRRYIHEAFPDSAPQLGLPPFAPSAPPPARPLMPTNRPPARADVAAPGPSSEELRPPPLPNVEDVAPSQLSEPAIQADAFVVDIEESIRTERPPNLDDVIASTPHPALATQRLDTNAPEESQIQTSERTFPSEPPGLYEDVPADTPSYDAGPDTNPAPAPADHASLAESPWDDTTEFEPVGAPLTTVESNPDADEWGDDATQIVDPRSADGNGR
ncbi:MAG: protein kinase [Sandaracinaceae bacterium]|nr:protein kinase [Sandaracinaceae bacterium]